MSEIGVKSHDDRDPLQVVAESRFLQCLQEGLLGRHARFYDGQRARLGRQLDADVSALRPVLLNIAEGDIGDLAHRPRLGNLRLFTFACCRSNLGG